MKYILANVPGFGHINPTLPVVEELVARGEEVVYYVPDTFKEAVESVGATFHPYELDLNNIIPPTGMGQGGPMPGFQIQNALPFRMIKESQRILPQVLEQLRQERPDALLYDPMCFWARIAAQVLHIPAIQLRPSYAINEHVKLFPMGQGNGAGAPVPPPFMQQIREDIAELCKQYQLPPFDLQSILGHAESLNIVFMPRAFQPAGKTFDERFVFVGPSLRPRHEKSDFPLEALEGAPVLYISLGTVFNNQLEFFKGCIDAFGDTEQKVVLSYGKRIQPAELGPLPANFIAAAYTPQLEVLAHTDVFVTHGGMNSTMESLSYGVPMVVLPQMIEQQMTARRVSELGMGVMLESSPDSAQALREAVEHVRQDASFRARAQEMQRAIQQTGGYCEAADAIMDYTQKTLQKA
ncbi:putative UDP-glucosyltransferase YjiC [Ktedonobacter sp. SOSP1-85]|uniref:macrolide family glycosyltransferase n=1 Tax=Ktedonobacter sp. SOSP1-85 TaxID=2778367 RepID=UPI001915A0C3|nr:macrolide family glycosyltransferase [Ktedonobacter sp. SOSP1-85]GHO81908.1 putative UDP-glucosyltransferase YjiC [Ktedonobacter sp. SOSP1-85]